MRSLNRWALAGMTLAIASVCAAFGGLPPRSAYCDGFGVLRWSDDRSEVAIFGVNYYTPFHVEYIETGKRGFDHKEVIRRDVANFRRLGLTALRVHCFDREISDKDGHLLENHHLDLLDYLIAECASNGMWTVLTPIAGWGLTSGDAAKGFGCGTSHRQLSSDIALLAPQQRYLEEFAKHINRYTGHRYADDPAVLAFELINEPDYQEGSTATQIADYANALLDAIRRSSTRKPIFYNTMVNGARGIVALPYLNVDGITGGCYCTGLRAGRALDMEGSQLAAIKTCRLDSSRDPALRRFAKIVYEFDAADVYGAYMYPAMAKMFRHEGVQCATQFQYESFPVAFDNPCYKTHYLHLIYTPEKALSLAIAAEAFRRLPRRTSYEPAENEIVFPPFRVNAAANLSEMVTETDYLYTAKPLTLPPAPEKLRRVWGCGASSVASSDGTGAYFLDRIEAGVWRLQVFPSVMPIADPFTGKPGPKTIVLSDAPSMKVSLPDLGIDFAVESTTGRVPVVVEKGGRFKVASGDYILMSSAHRSDAAAFERARAANIPPYWAPPPDVVNPSWTRWYPSWDAFLNEARKIATTYDRWNFLGEKTGRIGAKNYLHSCVTRRIPASGRLWDELFHEAGDMTHAVIVGRSLTTNVEPVEISLRLSDKTSWGIVVRLPSSQTVLRVPLSEFRYFGHTPGARPFEPGMKLDINKLCEIFLCTGRWLDPSAVARPHYYELESLCFEKGEK